MDYQDFTIDVRSAAEEGFFVAGMAEAPDMPQVSFPRPMEPETLRELLTTLDRRASPSTRAITEEPDLWALGHQLFRSLMRGELAERFKERQETMAGVEGCGLRLRLRFDLADPEAEYLAALPWELLRDAGFLCPDLSTPVVRDVLRKKPRRSLGVEPPLRVLVVGAAVPGSKEESVVKQERERIEKALEALIDSGQADLVRLREASLENLYDTLRNEDEPIHVLHFVGHGGYHEASKNGAVVFIRPDGSKFQVNGETFAAHLKSVPGLRLVVLNSCKTARHAGRAGAPFNFGVAAALLDRTDIPAVVAHQYSISFGAALQFSDILYRRIAAGDDLDTALGAVRLSLRNVCDEWETPVLFLGSTDGKLLDFKPVRRSPTRRVRRPPGEPVCLGIRSREGWGRDMRERNCEVLDLVRFFRGRYIKKQQSWQEEVFPRLQQFLLTNAEEGRPLVLDFAAHSSIAFAAGWVLEAKSGLDVRVRQRTGEVGEFEWYPTDHEERPVPEGPLWRDEPDLEISTGGPDIAVALAVSQSEVAEQVRSYVERQRLPVGRILRATVPEPGACSVAGGAHSLLLAQTIVSRVRQRQPHEREGTCHLFCAAPNALVFYLGQLSRSFGRIVLYEHPLGKKDAWGKYRPAIELEEKDEPEDWSEW